MNLAKEAQQIIRSLETEEFYAQCPCCDEPILLRDAGLFYKDGFPPEGKALHRLMVEGLRERRHQLKHRRKAISEKSETGAKAVNIGFILERLAPCMKGFAFERNDCRSLFDPIDYVIFEGLSKRGVVSRILFVDIKSGASRLKVNQKQIKELVERKRVEWDTYDPEVGR